MTHKIGAIEGALHRGAEAVAGAHGDVADATARVRALLEALRWEGEAAKAYNRMLDTWIADAGKLNAVLVELERAMRQAEADRAAREEENVGTIAALGTTIGGLGTLMTEV